MTLDTQVSQQLARTAAHAAADKSATEVTILDIGDLIGITDFFVIVSASNERQLSTVADEVQRKVKQVTGRGARRREGSADTGWMLLDYGEIVVHAFTVEQRLHYGLERLWSDAPRLDPQLPEPVAAAVGPASPE